MRLKIFCKNKKKLGIDQPEKKRRRIEENICNNYIVVKIVEIIDA